MKFSGCWSLFTRTGLLLLALATGVPPGQAAEAPKVAISILGSQLRLSWGPLEAGAASTVETSGSLSNPDWQPLGGTSGWPLTATQWSGPLPDSGGGFYRVVVRPVPARGILREHSKLRSYTAAEMQAVLVRYGLPPGSQLPVEAWKVQYSTLDAKGAATIASALVVLPVGAGRALPLVAYQHGTITERESVPSRLAGEADVGLVLGGSGYVAVLADYIGLGDSPGFHPYQHAASEASAVLDALRAATALVAERGLGWNRQLFLTGYSQGGHATLAAHRELELHHADEFTITASAPCAGAYDMSGTTLNDFLSSRVPPNPYYSAYLLKAYVETYDVAPGFASVLRPPYDTTLPPLLDGQHSGGTISAAMPAHPSEILRADVLEQFQSDPHHPLRLALADNDLYRDWYPKVPTRFYHCGGDKDVLPANSQVAYSAFKAAGAPSVELYDPVPFADHNGCAPFSLFGTKLWFDSLKK